MSEFYDTLFINSKLALKVAKQENRISLYNGSGTQLCYYTGKEIKNAPKNLVLLPLDNIRMFFTQESFRLPEYIDFNSSAYENDEEKQVWYKNVLLNLFKEIAEEEQEKNSKLLEELKVKTPYKLDSNCLNIVIIVSKALEYNYYYAKQLKKSFREIGHKVSILSESGSKKILINQLKTNFILTKLDKTEPNVVVFINDYKPDILMNSQFQISIINGFISLIKSTKTENIRKRDIFLSQNQYVNKLFIEKGIHSHFVETAKKFTKKDAIKKKNKYQLGIFSGYFDLSEYILFEKMIDLFMKDINTKILTINEIVQYLINNKHDNKNDYEMMLYLQRNIVLQSCVKWLDSRISNVTLFGGNWNNFAKLRKNIKVKKKGNLKKEYSKCKYILHVSSNIIDLNLLDILDSGAIPLIYDLRAEDVNYKSNFDNYCLFFKNKQELNKILEHNLIPKKQFDSNDLNSFTFLNITQKIESLILHEAHNN